MLARGVGRASGKAAHTARRGALATVLIKNSACSVRSLLVLRHGQVIASEQSVEIVYVMS